MIYGFYKFACGWMFLSSWLNLLNIQAECLSTRVVWYLRFCLLSLSVCSFQFHLLRPQKVWVPNVPNGAVEIFFSNSAVPARKHFELTRFEVLRFVFFSQVIVIRFVLFIFTLLLTASGFWKNFHFFCCARAAVCMKSPF